MSWICETKWRGVPSAARVDVSLLQVVRANLAVEHPPRVLEVDVEIVWMGDLLEGARHECRGVVAGEVAQRLVHLEEPAVRRDQRHADRRRLERPAELPLALEQRVARPPALGEVVDDPEHAFGRAVRSDDDGRHGDRDLRAVAPKQHGLDGDVGRPPGEPLLEPPHGLRAGFGRDERGRELAEQLRLAVPRHRLTGRVDRGEAPGEIERADEVVAALEQELRRLRRQPR